MNVRLAFVLTTATLATACHGRYRRTAPGMGSVRVVTTVDGTASVRVPAMEAAGDTSNPAVGISQLVAGVVLFEQAEKIEAKLSKSADSKAVRAAVEAGLATGASTYALPFEVREDGDHPLHVTVVDHGFVVDSGLPALETVLRLELLDGQTHDRMYRTTHTCTTPISSTDVPDLPMLGPHEIAAFGLLRRLPAESMGPWIALHAEDCAVEAMQWMGVHAGTEDRPKEEWTWVDADAGFDAG